MMWITNEFSSYNGHAYQMVCIVFRLTVSEVAKEANDSFAWLYAMRHDSEASSFWRI